MRKPNAFPPSRIVQLTLAVLAFSACDSGSPVAGKPVSTDSVTGSGAATTIGNFAGRDEAKAERLAVVNQSASLTATAPASPPLARAAASDAGGARSDISLGTPIPSIDPTGAMLVRHGQASIDV